jgi:Transposase IS66 family
VLSAVKLHADNTPVPVLAPGQENTKTLRLWTYVRDDRPAGGVTPPAVWFAYSPDRKGEHPRAHLHQFTGTLQADGYAGFEQIHETGCIQEAACWADVRRKFYDLQVAHKSPVAAEAFERIGALYTIEKEQVAGHSRHVSIDRSVLNAYDDVLRPSATWIHLRRPSGPVNLGRLEFNHNAAATVRRRGQRRIVNLNRALAIWILHSPSRSFSFLELATAKEFQPNRMVNDVRYAVRTMLRAPLFTAAVILTVALAITLPRRERCDSAAAALQSAHSSRARGRKHHKLNS